MNLLKGEEGPERENEAHNAEVVMGTTAAIDSDDEDNKIEEV